MVEAEQNQTDKTTPKKDAEIFGKYKTVIALFVALFGGGGGLYIFQSFGLFAKPLPNLIATAESSEFEYPDNVITKTASEPLSNLSLKEGFHNIIDGRQTFILISLTNSGKLPAEEVRIITNTNVFQYKLNGNESKLSEDSTINIGRIDVGKTTTVRIWSIYGMRDNKLTVAHQLNSFQIAINAGKQNSIGYIPLALGLLVNVVTALLVFRSVQRERKRIRNDLAAFDKDILDKHLDEKYQETIDQIKAISDNELKMIANERTKALGEITRAQLSHLASQINTGNENPR